MRLGWGVPALGAAAVLAVSACDIGFASIEETKTEQAAIAEIRISGGDGDVTVRPGPAGQAQIRQKISYFGDEPPGTTYRVEGNILHLDTDCGRRCGVSYDVKVPEGVRVTGESGSGDVSLTGVSTVDLEVSSGNASVTRASGRVDLRAHSGEVRLTDIRADLTAHASSGNIEATGVRAAAELTASSGNVRVELASPASVKVEASSGDVTLRVPAGVSYRVDAETSSGDRRVDVPTDPASAHRLDVHASSGDVTVTAT
jgi:DUF4097 and DUF4098 domain-containing protein YvlB